GPQGQSYYSIWFTDKTTGKETYHVGRYLDFELNDDPEFVYELDFNRAYNPYCATVIFSPVLFQQKTIILILKLKPARKIFILN
ncbi:MAG TPA: DUF1684 domain-containing protein, partial [Ignavibacteriaceae bacterium]